MPLRSSTSSKARDWALVRYRTAQSLSEKPSLPISISISADTASASSCSSYTEISRIRSPPLRSVQSFLAARSVLWRITPCAASRITWVER
jgi:hypothetical protein